MKISTQTRFSLSLLALAVSLTWLAGCATTRHTEQLLTEAGFRRIAASTDQQAQHLLTLPPNQLTIAKIHGQNFYVFPDHKNHQIFVGNAEEYQTYQQILSYNQIAGTSRVLAFEDHEGSGDAAKWAAWSSATGWTHGTISD